MSNRVVNGILVIVIGIVLLMNTTGYLPWSVWDVLLQYWPLLIIGLGVQTCVFQMADTWNCVGAYPGIDTVCDAPVPWAAGMAYDDVVPETRGIQSGSAIL